MLSGALDASFSLVEGSDDEDEDDFKIMPPVLRIDVKVPLIGMAVLISCRSSADTVMHLLGQWEAVRDGDTSVELSYGLHRECTTSISVRDVGGALTVYFDYGHFDSDDGVSCGVPLSHCKDAIGVLIAQIKKKLVRVASRLTAEEP